MQLDHEMVNNKLIIAAAGSGKTNHLVQEALVAPNDSNILITTYTENNEEEIRERFFKKNGHIPKNVTVQTWFSVLLQHGVRPYQGYLYEPDIKGMVLVSGQSALRSREADVEKHYLNDEKKIYSDKIAKFICKCNEESNNAVMQRLAQIYTHIFIDELQDLAGYDLDFLKLLCQSKINMLLVCDPRQSTYSTNNAAKNKGFRGANIIRFFDDINIEKDETSLTTNHRSIPPICDLSNTLFPRLRQTTSGNQNTTDHDGVFLVKKKDVPAYLEKYTPVQLRSDRKTQIVESHPVMNFGESKGRSFERVLIYPTEPIKKWLKNHGAELPPTSCSKLYVAITRARQSVAFVYDYRNDEQIEGCEKYTV